MTWLQQGSFLGALDVATVEVAPCGCTYTGRWNDNCPEAARLMPASGSLLHDPGGWRQSWAPYIEHRKLARARIEAAEAAWYRAAQEACP